MKIVSIDDNELYILILKKSIESKTGIIIDCYFSLEKFFELNTENPDVVFLDNQFKGIKGIDAVDTLIKKYPDVKIVVLSASDDEVLKEQYIKKGAFDFLNKTLFPVDEIVSYLQEKILKIN